MALTATATSQTLSCITEWLLMTDPVLVGLPPDCFNMFYLVKTIPSVDKFCFTIRSMVNDLGLETPKTLIFCQTYNELYYSMRKMLGDQFNYPTRLSRLSSVQVD